MFPARISWLLVPLLLVGLFLSAVWSVSQGSANIPFNTALEIVFHMMGAGSTEPEWSLAQQRIVWDLRIPRVLLAILVGAGLACCGVVLQNLTRNPLADPYLFGVSSGASLGAVLVIVHIGMFAGSYSLPLAAFAGALLSLSLVLLVSRNAISQERLVLAGVGVSFVLMAATNYAIFAGDQRAAHSVVFWTLGGLGLARWQQLWLPALVVGGGLLCFIRYAGVLNAFLLGDELARTLGIAVHRKRVILFALCALITSTLVALAGAIGFVGLVVPHLLRPITGNDCRRLLPYSALAGAWLMVWVDYLSRTIMAPQELPIGIVTASLGGCYFLWFLWRKGR